MDHVRGAPCHPQTQGKIERWHQTLKNRILLENYYLPGDLEARNATLHPTTQTIHSKLSNVPHGLNSTWNLNINDHILIDSQLSQML